MADIEIHIDLEGRVRRLGLARLNKARGAEKVKSRKQAIAIGLSEARKGTTRKK